MAVFLPSFSTLTLPGPFVAAPALHPLDFVFLEKKLDALGVFLDDFFLARDDVGPVDLQPADFKSQLRAVLEIVVDLGVVQQHLGGNATDVQAGAAEERVFLHHHGFQAQLAGANGGDVTPRTAPDNRHIVLCHSLSPFRRSLIWIVAAETRQAKNCASADGCPEERSSRRATWRERLGPCKR